MANCWPGDGKDARQILPGQDVDEGEHGQVGDCLASKAIMFSTGQHPAGTTVYPHFMLEVSRGTVLRLLRSQIFPGDDRIYKHTLDHLEGDNSPVRLLKRKLSSVNKENIHQYACPGCKDS